MIDWPALAASISSATRQPCQIAGHAAAGGGSINQAYRIRAQDGRQFFLKLNAADRLAMFSAEAAGLDEIAATRTIRVPQPVTHGRAGRHAFLVLEQLDLHGRGDAGLLGEQLAALHRITPDRAKSGLATPCDDRTAKRFGFIQDNFIGTSPQPNAWSDEWLAFWREQRLGFQLRLAAKNGDGGRLQRLGERLLQALPGFFAGHTPQPSLLHGDLWGGNHGYLANGEPVLFDPAPYYGDREADIAMAELFGGFDASFYTAYRAAYPLDDGYAVRRDLYNLYHILNHANLFGGSYARQAEQMMQRLLSELG